MQPVDVEVAEAFAAVVIEVKLCTEYDDLVVRLPAVPRIGDTIFRDNPGGPEVDEYVVTEVQWYWDLTDSSNTDVEIMVSIDPKNRRDQDKSTKLVRPLFDEAATR